jgi:hypothetical protein
MVRERTAVGYRPKPREKTWMQRLVFDSTFEAVALFSLLGLALSAAFLLLQVE